MMIAHIVAPETFTMNKKMNGMILGEAKYFNQIDKLNSKD
jgi:hypothetical protein